MNYPHVDRYDVSLLSRAFTVGLGDSINSGNLAIVLVFIIFLSLVGFTVKRIVLLGMLYIGAVCTTQFMSMLGAWDYLFSHTHALRFTRVIYLLAAAFFLLLGIGHILDWWRYKKCRDVECFRLSLPAFLRGNAQHVHVNRNRKWKIFAGIRLVMLTIVAAFVTTLLAATFPQNEYVFVIHSFMMAGGDKIFFYQSFAFYCLAMILPLIVLWIAILWIVRKNTRSISIILYYKIISSALFLSVGTGLGYFFLT